MSSWSVRLPLAAVVAVAASALVAGPASAARRPHVPPPPPAPSARSGPVGVHGHVRVVHLDRTRRHARRHGGGARAASLPPVNLASVPMWGSGSAFCDSLNLNSYTHAFTDFVYAPAADEAPSAPGKAFLRVYWRAGLQLWDPVRNAWRANPPVTTWAVSNPMDDFAFWFSPSIPDGGVSMAPGTRAYGYTWVEMWWHYTATADESWSGTGGIWYKATGYLRQNGYGGTTSNGACWWA